MNSDSDESDNDEGAQLSDSLSDDSEEEPWRRAPATEQSEQEEQNWWAEFLLEERIQALAACLWPIIFRDLQWYHSVMKKKNENMKKYPAGGEESEKNPAVKGLMYCKVTQYSPRQDTSA